jgi:hypothetical protein
LRTDGGMKTTVCPRSARRSAASSSCCLRPVGTWLRSTRPDRSSSPQPPTPHMRSCLQRRLIIPAHPVAFTGVTPGKYTHGHHESVLRSHRWRTAENSAAYLLPSLRPGMRLLDVGFMRNCDVSRDAKLKHPGFDAHLVTCDRVCFRSDRERSPYWQRARWRVRRTGGLRLGAWLVVP